MSAYIEKRYHPRVTVQWPTIFFTRQCAGHGTVVDVSALAWRIRGSTPVQVGMQLVVLVWPPGLNYLEIEEATVLWVREHEFAVEIYQVRSEHIPAMDKLQEQTLGSCPRFHVSRRKTIGGLIRQPRGGILPHCHIRYRLANEGYVAMEEGLLNSVSTIGCQFYSKAALESGDLVTVILYFNDGHAPIGLPGTCVCWARNHRFGVRFPEITCEERKRLESTQAESGIIGSDQLTPDNEMDARKLAVQSASSGKWTSNHANCR